MENSTKKKWLWGIGIVVVLAAIGSMQEKKEGSELKIPQQTERVAEQPQETKADRQQREQKEKTVEPKKKEVVESKKEDGLLAIYEVTDKVGCTICIAIKDDKSATVTVVGGENTTHYCTWDDFTRIKGGIGIWFGSYKEVPHLVFEGGSNETENKGNSGGSIKDGWYYVNVDRAEANNPQWRLPAKKIK